MRVVSANLGSCHSSSLLFLNKDDHIDLHSVDLMHQHRLLTLRRVKQHKLHSRLLNSLHVLSTIFYHAHYIWVFG